MADLTIKQLVEIIMAQAQAKGFGVRKENGIGSK